MKRSIIAGSMARASARLIDNFVGLDIRNPADALPRGAPDVSRYWYLNPGTWLALLMIAAYQRLVPARRKRVCRFDPPCSTYMSIAIRKYGLGNGSRRGLHRIRRCTGFVPGGEDLP
jgi:putative component of membrane protein insertase Oxa1/YidC/SpoIIIJ protein YidD